jgi:exosortase
VRLRPWWPAWGGLVLTLLARGLFHLWGNQWGEVATLLPALACLTLTFGGWGLFRRAWPAIAYLVFMMPLPAKVDNAVALPLQMLATSASVGVLQLTGLWVIAEGNVINVGADRLEVATACNGLSMLETLAATVTAMILLLPVRRWKQLVLLASAVPIALASNVARIAATAWCYQKYGAVAGERFAHDAAGWLMMPLALAAVGLELLLLNWVVVEEETVEEPSLLGRPIARGRTPARGRPARPGPADDRTVEDRETP